MAKSKMGRPFKREEDRKIPTSVGMTPPLLAMLDDRVASLNRQSTILDKRGEKLKISRSMVVVSMVNYCLTHNIDPDIIIDD